MQKSKLILKCSTRSHKTDNKLYTQTDLLMSIAEAKFPAQFVRCTLKFSPTSCMPIISIYRKRFQVGGISIFSRDQILAFYIDSVQQSQMYSLRGANSQILGWFFKNKSRKSLIGRLPSNSSQENTNKINRQWEYMLSKTIHCKFLIAYYCPRTRHGQVFRIIHNK